MAITYKEIKGTLTDLGFEIDDEVDNEYPRVRRNAINRTLDVLWSTVILPNIGYFEEHYDTDEDAGGLLHVDEDTEDDDLIDIPQILEPLLALLTAHWLWLDDDITKATIYWNEYDDIKNQILATIAKPRNAQIIGGF